MGTQQWRGRMGGSVYVDSVSELCRSRSVTHILMSPEVFNEYSAQITPRHAKSGIRRGTCHGVGIVIVDGMTSNLMFAFNRRRAKAASQLLVLARAEEHERVLDLIDKLLLCDKPAKWIHIGSTPTSGDEDVEAT